jgi:HAD superfamily hydrolase (TIGR01509 family)
MPHSLQAVVFDMDGLMLDTERIYHSAFQAAGADLGYDFDEQLLLSTTGRTIPDCYWLIVEHFGPAFPLAVFEERWPHRWREEIARHGIPQKPGLIELLDWLDERQIPKAVATSTAWEDARFTLQSGGIAGRFALLVTGDQISNGKPAPDIYLLAAARLGIDPTRCAALEDSEAGVLAAATAGMTTIMVPDTQIPSPAVATRAALVAPSLHEAKHWLAARPWSRP